MRKINYLVVHHTAGPRNATREQIKAMHLARGFSDIGYHKLIWPTGAIAQGRPDDVMGAHARGLNQDTLGISCVGNYEELEPPAKLIDALVSTLTALCKRHGLTADAIIGHRDARSINPKADATLCPGKHLYALLPDIRRRVADGVKK